MMLTTKQGRVVRLMNRVNGYIVEFIVPDTGKRLIHIVSEDKTDHHAIYHESIHPLMFRSLMLKGVIKYEPQLTDFAIWAKGYYSLAPKYRSKDYKL